jgi:hypothetical protein
MYAGSYVVNPYTTVYGDGGYMTVYGKAEPSDDKKYKHLLKLMAHKVRVLKHLRKAKGNRADKLKKKLSEVTSKIKHLKKLLQSKGVNTSQAEAQAVQIEGQSSEGTVQLPDGRRIPRRLLRRMRGASGGVSSIEGRDHVRRRQGVGVRQGAGPERVMAQMDEGQRRGRRGPPPGESQGPISASEVQAAQAVDEADVADAGAMDLAGMFPFMGFSMNQVLLYGGLLLGGVYLLKMSKKR